MGRPRGFIYDWKPKPQVQHLIDAVNEIIDTSPINPLTLRQIYYMLVSKKNLPFAFDKTQQSYKRMCETMNKARRAKMTDMDDIRDDGLTREENRGWGSRGSFINWIKRHSRDFTLGRQDDQETKLYLWCEAAGMVPQLATAVEEYHIPVLSSGGFDSVTSKHNLARELTHHNQRVVILHLGDYDPSGVHMYSSLEEDLQAFMENMQFGYPDAHMEMHRLAVTPEQIDELDLETAPVKASDNRSFDGDSTTQCEAIDPLKLREIVQEEVLRYIDKAVFDETLEREEELKLEMVGKFGDLE